MSVNKVILVGNVGKDPEVRYLDGNGQNGQGTKVATFTLATSEKFRDRNGELRENTEWHNIVAWRQSADVAERFVKKGTQLYIEGKLRTRAWTDQSGAKRYTTEINVDTLQLLGRRDDNSQGYGPAPELSYQPSYQSASQPRPQAQAQPFQQAQSAPQPQSFQQPQPFQQPAQPAQPAPRPQPQPAPQAAPQAAPIDLGIDEGPTDDLPF